MVGTRCIIKTGNCNDLLINAQLAMVARRVQDLSKTSIFRLEKLNSKYKKNQMGFLAVENGIVTALCSTVDLFLHGGCYKASTASNRC